MRRDAGGGVPLPAGRCSSPTPATWSPSAGGLSRTASPTSDPSLSTRALPYICQQWAPCASPRPPSPTRSARPASVRGRRARHRRDGDPFGLHLDRGRTGAVHGGICGTWRRISQSRNLTPRGIDVMALCACYAAGRKWDAAGGTPCLPPFPPRGSPWAAPRGAVDRRPHGPVLPHT